MGRTFQEFVVLAGGLACGSAFTVIALFIAGAFY